MEKVEENTIRSIFLEAQGNLMNVVAALQTEIEKLEENEKASPFLLARKKNQVTVIINFNNSVEDLLSTKSTEIEVSKAELILARRVLKLAYKEETIEEIKLSEMIKKRREGYTKTTPPNG